MSERIGLKNFSESGGGNEPVLTLLKNNSEKPKKSFEFSFVPVDAHAESAEKTRKIFLEVLEKIPTDFLKDDLKNTIVEIFDSLNNVLQSTIGQLYDLDEGNTLMHSINTIIISNRFVKDKDFNFSDEEVLLFFKACLLHDIGKIDVPSEIVNKKGRFTPEETKEMKLHPLHGFQLVAKEEENMQIAVLLASHHEKELLEHEKSYSPVDKNHICFLTEETRQKFFAIYQEPFIKKASRLMTLVDIFEALTSVRPYKHKFTILKSLQIMQEEDQQGLYYSPYFKLFYEKMLKEDLNEILRQEIEKILDEKFYKEGHLMQRISLNDDFIAGIREEYWQNVKNSNSNSLNKMIEFVLSELPNVLIEKIAKNFPN